jgi:hypothetical protein
MNLKNFFFILFFLIIFFHFKINYNTLLAEESYPVSKFWFYEKKFIDKESIMIHNTYTLNCLKNKNHALNNEHDFYFLKKKLFFFFNKNLNMNYNHFLIKNNTIYSNFKKKEVFYYVLKYNFFFNNKLNLKKDLNSNIIIYDYQDDYKKNIYKFLNGDSIEFGYTVNVNGTYNFEKILKINDHELKNHIDIISIKNLNLYYNDNIRVILKNRFIDNLYLVHLNDPNSIDLRFFEKKINQYYQLQSFLGLSLLNDIDNVNDPDFEQKKKIIISIFKNFRNIENVIEKKMSDPENDIIIKNFVERIFKSNSNQCKFKESSLDEFIFEKEIKNNELFIDADKFFLLSDFSTILKGLEYSFNNEIFNN